MGMLAYGSPEHVCVIDDRVLMHLQIVIIDKLRRSERFSFSWNDGRGLTTLWMAPDIPLRFHFFEPVDTRINRSWIAALERAALCVHGLHFVDEPGNVRTPLVTAPARELAGVHA